MDKPKQRLAFTDRDRQRLRHHHCSYPGLTPQQLASWFENETERRVANSSIYDILSDKYAYLDSAEATDAVRKKKGPQWAELENALFNWWAEVQPCDVTGKELKIKANEIWQTLPACRGKKIPSFSDGWLSNWRVRHGLAQPSRSTSIEIAGSAHLLDWKISGPAPPLMKSSVAAYYAADINFSSSKHPTICDPRMERAPRSTADFFAPNTLSSQSNGNMKALEPRAKRLKTQGWYNVRGLEFATSQSLDAIKFLDTIPRRNSPKAVAPICETPWKGVQELFLRCNGLKGHELAMKGKIVTDCLEPILNSQKYEISGWYLDKIAATNLEKALHLFLKSETFRVQQARDDSQHLLLEEWLLDFVDTDVLRYSSPEPAAEERESLSSSGSLRDIVPFRWPKGTKCLTAIISSCGRDERVDIRTRSYKSCGNGIESEAIEQFQAEIVITPPLNVHSVPQTVVHLGMQTRGHRDTLPMSMISFRTIIPFDSEVFRIAGYGNSTDLQKILSSGAASLTDRDPEGRSLINYALRKSNPSTLKFLITKVEDIDAFEVDNSNHQMPLISLLPSDARYLGFAEDEKSLTCLKIMLCADADVSLTYEFNASKLELELTLGSLAALKALLDIGKPYVNVNATTSRYSGVTPLLHLTEWFARFGILNHNVSEKIFLVIERGADVARRDFYGQTCLHLVLELNTEIVKNRFDCYEEEEFKDILMNMVAAGANVYASDYKGRTVSQTACGHGNEELWTEVLAECGYDPDEVFCLEEDFNIRAGASLYVRSEKFPGMGVFSVTPRNIPRTKLSFRDYSRQRKPIKYNTPESYFPGCKRLQRVRNERREFWEAFIGSSDSEDEDQSSTRPSKRKNRAKVTGGYPALLHDGVHWQTAFS